MKSLRISLWGLAAVVAIAVAPWGVRADLLYVSSTGENAIRAYNATSGNFTSTFFSTTSTTLNIPNPQGIAISGNFLFVSSNNNIFRFDLTNGTQTTVVTLGAAAVIHDLAFDPISGRLFASVQGTGFDNVEAFTGVTGVSGFPITTANKIISLSASKPVPEGITFATNGDLYIVDAGSGANQGIERLLAASVAGTGAATSSVYVSAANAGLLFDLTFGPNRNGSGSASDLYVTVFNGSGATHNSSIAVFDVAGATGTYINDLNVSQPGTNTITKPSGIVFRTSDTNFYAVQNGNNAATQNVQKVTFPGGAFSLFSQGTQPNHPSYLAFGPNAVPEPGTLALLGLTGGVLGFYAWRAKRKQKSAA